MSAESTAAGIVETVELPEGMDLLEFAILHSSEEEAWRAAEGSPVPPEARLPELDLTEAERDSLWQQADTYSRSRADVTAEFETAVADLGLALVRSRRQVARAGGLSIIDPLPEPVQRALDERRAALRRNEAYQLWMDERKRIWREAHALSAELYAHVPPHAEPLIPADLDTP